MTGSELAINREGPALTPLHGTALPSDEKIEKLYRLAKAFAISGVYKDVEQAEQAFAKLIIGDDLGLSVAQSMQAIQFVRGQIQVHYATLAMIIKSRGYTWEKIERSEARAAAKFFDPDGNYLDEVEFTMENAVTAGLTKSSSRGEPSMYTKYPRNMLWARMMSDAVRFVIPEATGGVPVYTPGEIPTTDRNELTAGEGNGDVQGLQFSEAVEETIARAERLGHAGLSDRGYWSVKIGSTTPVDRLVAQANTDLDDYEARRTAPPTDATSEPDVPIDTADLPEPQPPTPAVEDPSSADQASSVAAEVAVAAEELPVVRRTDVPHFHNADEAAAYWASHQLADEGAEETEEAEDVVPAAAIETPAYWMIKPHGKKRFETREAAEKALADFGRTGYRVVGLTASGKVVEDLGGGDASGVDAPLLPEAADGPALEPAAQGTPVGGSEPDLPPSNPNEVEKLRRHLAILDELAPDSSADDEEAAEWKTERDMVEAKLAALGEQAAKNDPEQGSLL